MSVAADRTGEGRITGRYAGGVSRLAAFAVDGALMVAAYGVVVNVVAFTLRTVLGIDIDVSEPETGWWAIAYIVWIFLYMSISLIITGRTVGKWLCGLRVVQGPGSPLKPRSAVVRVVVFPLSFLLLGLGFIGILVGRRHRALHDVIAGTAVVYDWGDRPAMLPAPLTRFLARQGALEAVPLPVGDDGAVR